MQVHLPVVMILDTDDVHAGVVVLEECSFCDSVIRQSKMKAHLKRHDKEKEETSGRD